ncbi:NADH-quinone oxidoreductase subunit H [Desulfuromonas versatilis]|uniref:NADH-quinone oxidoreductase subunit H n=1 Tax=Desulfuromonas versatilis TaxID=2802975 RepID=A0ABM8HYL9_9BACT|nr:complex I subunit 1 family protein [Desulfuromonas versatilis]BCR05689.1 NADH-quinone oxidoreductase subunit H [Desulfuromonas versatilis]
MIQDLVIYLLYMGFAIGLMLGMATLFTWVERKQSAIMADRIGANRAYLRIPFTNIKLVAWGLFHGLADGAKMLLKEDFTPNTYDRFCYNLAPWLAAVPVLLVFAVVPFGGTLIPGELLDPLFPALGAALREFFGARSYSMQVAHLDAGILVVLAISGIGILGTMLAGWSSNNKFSLLGSARAASQMISYEVTMGLALLSLVVSYGTLDLGAMVRGQSQLLFGALPAWGICLQPLAFVLFLTAAIAENKRVPFDLPECESELVSGYFTEYGAMKMGLFMLSEFIEIVVASALLVTLFLGGYNLPYLGDGGFVFPFGVSWQLPHLAVVLLQVVTFVVKIFLAGCFMIQIRWSLPRFRYDQLMDFGWKFLMPLAALNLVATVVVRWLVLRG